MRTFLLIIAIWFLLNALIGVYLMPSETVRLFGTLIDRLKGSWR